MPWLKKPDVALPGIRDTLFNHGQLSWAAMVANGQNQYDGALYDTFSFRNDQFTWSPLTGDAMCSNWSFINYRCNAWLPLVRLSRADRAGEVPVPQAAQAARRWVQARERFELRLPTTLPPLRVQSYFGGVGVYRVRYLHGCKYCQVKCTEAERMQNRSRLLCEHVPLHDCIARRNGGRVFLNPKMVIQWHHHSSHDGRRACAKQCAKWLSATDEPGRQLLERSSRHMGGMGRMARRRCRCPLLFSNGTHDMPGQEVMFRHSAVLGVKVTF